MKRKNLFDYLNSIKKPRHTFFESDEFSFFMENRSVLRKFPRFAFLFDKEENEFEVMRGNIIIYAFQNKKTLELEIKSLSKQLIENNQLDHIKYVNTIKERLIDCPYFLYGKEKIYLPIFTAAMNDIYIRMPEQLLEKPYDALVDDFQHILVDPFDTYGTSLFDSSFTRLINVGTDGKITAFFHYDTLTIYFINNQGRLDHKIVCFDKYLDHPNYNHMLERVRPVVDAYFNHNRSDLLVSLFDNKLISSKALSHILTKN